MEVISADDFTFPVYFYVPDGKGWFTLTRGQCLIFLDARSWRVIAYSLQPERNYNSLVIPNGPWRCVVRFASSLD